jgi:hypothetical protein
MKFSEFVLVTAVVLATCKSALGQGAHAGATLTSGSAVQTNDPLTSPCSGVVLSGASKAAIGCGGSSTSSTPHATSGSRSSGKGDGGGGNLSAEISQQMHDQLAADNAARDMERDSLAATGATDQSNLNAVFDSATLASTNGTSSTVAAAELTGSSQTTSDNDFAMPTPSPEPEAFASPAPSADPTPTMPVAPAHNPDYSDVLPLKAGTDPSAAQMGVASPETKVTGVDDPNADPNVQAEKLLVVPTIQAAGTLADGAKLLEVGPAEFLIDKATDVVKDAVVDHVVESVKDGFNPPGYAPPPAPNPAPGPTPAPK